MTPSNPTNEKNTMDDAAKIPRRPKGAKGFRLPTCPNGKPAHRTYTITMIFVLVTTAHTTQAFVKTLQPADREMAEAAAQDLE